MPESVKKTASFPLAETELELQKIHLNVSVGREREQEYPAHSPCMAPRWDMLLGIELLLYGKSVVLSGAKNGPIALSLI